MMGLWVAWCALFWSVRVGREETNRCCSQMEKKTVTPHLGGEM